MLDMQPCGERTENETKETWRAKTLLCSSVPCAGQVLTGFLYSCQLSGSLFLLGPKTYWGSGCLSCAVWVCRLGADDRSLEHSLARAGCEVHCFDPSLRQPHIQQAEMWFHRLSVDWRDPSPAIVAQRQYTSTKKLATILNDFGHRQVRRRASILEPYTT